MVCTPLIWTCEHASSNRDNGGIAFKLCEICTDRAGGHTVGNFENKYYYTNTTV